jgi:hypothetical protein
MLSGANENLGLADYFSVTISNVNVQKGKTLRYKGKVFEGSESFSFTVYDEWGETVELNY